MNDARDRAVGQTTTQCVAVSLGIEPDVPVSGVWVQEAEHIHIPAANERARRGRTDLL